MISTQEVEAIIGTNIKNIDVYRKAFKHKSSVQHDGVEGSYETLEFMGDSVLGFIVTKYLFDRYENLQEGFLTRARTKIVCGKTLAEVSAKLGFHNWVQMDEKGMRNGWNNNPKILEDVFEAFVGAIYLDLGMIEAKKFVLGVLDNPDLIRLDRLMVDDNYKDILMRVCQSQKWDLPEYRQLDHVDATKFRVGVYVQGHQWGTGKGSTKKEAEQAGAYFTLKRLEEKLEKRLVPSKRPNAMIKNVHRK